MGLRFVISGGIVYEGREPALEQTSWSLVSVVGRQWRWRKGEAKRMDVHGEVWGSNRIGSEPKLKIAEVRDCTWPFVAPEEVQRGRVPHHHPPSSAHSVACHGEG